MSAARQSQGKIQFQILKVDGRVDPLQEILKLGGIPFTVNEIPVEKYLNMKDELPYRKLPCMTIEDGRLFSETPALLQYLGKRTNLIPSEPVQAMKALEICSALHRLTTTINKSIEVFAAGDKEKCEMLRKSINDVLAPHTFRTLEREMKEGKKCNNCGDICKCGAVCKCGPQCEHRYLVGNKLSIADIVLKCVVDEYRVGQLEMIDPDVFKKTVPDMDQYWYNNISLEMDNLFGTTK